MPKKVNGKPTHEADPFAGDFSQERIAQQEARIILQWHGGLAALAGPGESMKVNGGFFIDDERLIELGLKPEEPVAGFERVTLKLGGKLVPGWGAEALHLAFIDTDFSWEDRETGRLRFAPEEYELRKARGDGSERELRGRLRSLVAVAELLDGGVTEPVILSVRGVASKAVGRIHREVRRMAQEATRLRRRAGHEGSIPVEAFWVEMYAGEMEEVGEGKNVSTVSLPKADIPADLTREFLREHLVEEEYRVPGGTFDQWAAEYATWKAWGEGQSTEPGTVELAELAEVASADPRSAAERALQQIVQAQIADRIREMPTPSASRTEAQYKTFLRAIQRAGWDRPEEIAEDLALTLLGDALDEAQDLTQIEAVVLTEVLGWSHVLELLDQVWQPQEEGIHVG